MSIHSVALVPKEISHAPNEGHHYSRDENRYQTKCQWIFEDCRHENQQPCKKLRSESDNHFYIAHENQMPSHQNKIAKQEQLTPQLIWRCSKQKWPKERKILPRKRRDGEPICQNVNKPPSGKTKLERNQDDLLDLALHHRHNNPARSRRTRRDQQRGAPWDCPKNHPESCSRRAINSWSFLLLLVLVNM